MWCLLPFITAAQETVGEAEGDLCALTERLVSAKKVYPPKRCPYMSTSELSLQPQLSVSMCTSPFCILMAHHIGFFLCLPSLSVLKSTDYLPAPDKWLVQFFALSHSAFPPCVYTCVHPRIRTRNKHELLRKLYVTAAESPAYSAASALFPEFHRKIGSTSKHPFHNRLEIGFSNNIRRTRALCRDPEFYESLMVN